MLPYARRWFVYYAGSKEKAIYSTTKFKKYIFSSVSWTMEIKKDQKRQWPYTQFRINL